MERSLFAIVLRRCCRRHVVKGSRRQWAVPLRFARMAMVQVLAGFMLACSSTHTTSQGAAPESDGAKPAGALRQALLQCFEPHLEWPSRTAGLRSAVVSVGVTKEGRAVAPRLERGSNDKVFDASVEVAMHTCVRPGNSQQQEAEKRIQLRVAPQPPAANTSNAGQTFAERVQARLPKVRACYEAQLKDPSLAGELLVRLEVSPGGQIDNVSVVDDSLGSEKVRRCVIETIQQWTFAGARERATTLEIPFVFEPTAAQQTGGQGGGR